MSPATKAAIKAGTKAATKATPSAANIEPNTPAATPANNDTDTDGAFGLSPSTLAKIRRTLAQHPAVQRAVVYGSRAKGNHRPGSDIDLTLHPAPGTPIDHRELSDILDQIDDLLLPYTVDLSVFDQLNNPDLREHIERVGRVLYERGEGAV